MEVGIVQVSDILSKNCESLTLSLVWDERPSSLHDPFAMKRMFEESILNMNMIKACQYANLYNYAPSFEPTVLK